MSEVTGVIEQITFKEGSGKRGKWKQCSICVNDEWFGAFVNNDNEDTIDSLGKGDEVLVTYEQNGKFKNFSNVEVRGKSEVPAPQKAAGATGGEAAINFNQYRMSHGSGRNAAVDLVAAALAHDAQFSLDDKENRIIALPKAQNKRLDALVALINTLGDKFTEANWNAVPGGEVAEGDYEE